MTLGHSVDRELSSETSSRSDHRRDNGVSFFQPAFFGVFYLTMTTVQSFFNKQVFCAGFIFPIALMFVQMCGIVGFLFVRKWIQQCMASSSSSYLPLSDGNVASSSAVISLDHFYLKCKMLAPVAFFMTLNIVLGNWSLYYLDMNVFILIRSMTIVWVAILNYLILGKQVTREKYVPSTSMKCL